MNAIISVAKKLDDIRGKKSDQFGHTGPKLDPKVNCAIIDLFKVDQNGPGRTNRI